MLQINEEAIKKVTLLREQYLKLSTNDLFALLLAKLNSCPLVTGDDALRKAAKDEGVPVYGLLCILDNLIRNDILKPGEAADALEKILAEGGWLPKKECEARLRKWKS